ncbi:restriction endonuclease subunit S [Pedobacter sp. JCM 36344]|uniref:restriction endonuclease subunit S n=1 Tax=Pedobacter sp. JCM 36344 TaxID=3374280 RepID=UPI00397864E7
MKRYDKYKDSGVEGIGEIPLEWKVSRIKFIAKICGGQDQKDIIDESGIYPIFGTGGEFGKTNQYLHKGPSVLLGRKGTIDKPRYVDTPFWSVDTVFYTDIFKVTNPRFFFYLCTTINFELYKYGSAIPSMSRETLNNIAFPLPKTLKEQYQIAKYLDQKATKIDKLINDKHKLIELLNEEQATMISQAVTKGLNPNVPMKDSGVEWLGEVPEHWQLSKIKFICKIIGRIGFRGYTVQDLVKEGEGAISLSPSNIKNHILDISSDCTYLSWVKYEESPEIKVYEEDILVVKTGSTIGKIAIVPKKQPRMTLNPQLIVLKEIKMVPKFLYHIMTSTYFQSYFKIYTAGGSTPAISQEKINNLEIIFPDLEEQEKIVKEVDISIRRFHEITGKLNQEIGLLKEYKMALISEVVTGKVDVREEVIADFITGNTETLTNI